VEALDCHRPVHQGDVVVAKVELGPGEPVRLPGGRQTLVVRVRQVAKVPGNKKKVLGASYFAFYLDFIEIL
jgi:hypothetical protein